MSEKIFELLATEPDKTGAELEHIIAEMGQKPYRARQVMKNIFQRWETSFSQMTDLPLALRQELENRIRIIPFQEVRSLKSRDTTEKTLWQLDDNRYMESVAIPMTREGAFTVCLSVQTGCALGCSFCATGAIGAGRNLRSEEIIGQALALFARNRDKLQTKPDDDKPSYPNIVFMGMGEPFLNYGELSRALRFINHNDTLQVGARRITVSTVGLPEGIIRYSEDFPQMKLAVSLHAANDTLRKELMPIARSVSLDQLIASCHKAFEITSRRITFEYLVIEDVNDSEQDIRDLARLMRGLPSKINLIPYNPIKGSSFKAPPKEKLKWFQTTLLGISKSSVTIRKSHGRDIDGACGQLAANL